MTHKNSNTNDHSAREILLVTGYSGAGMSSVLKTLEDMGFEAFDNFPLSMVEPLLADQGAKSNTIAIGIDARTRGFSTDAVINLCRDHNAKLVFLSCDDAVLQRRFTEPRRKHPLAREKSVKSAIHQEKEILQGLRSEADYVIDTSDLSIHDLRHILEGHFHQKKHKRMTITLMSFGFKHGLPREADIVMDVRFVQNPHWEPELRPLTGKDKAVGDHIEKDPDYAAFIERFETMIKPLLPRYEKEGKIYLTIAIGCTGGRHRSVYTVEKIAKWLTENGAVIHIEHRDLKG